MAVKRLQGFKIAKVQKFKERNEKQRFRIKTMNVNKVVLAYSGGLDTSVILRWLKEEYSC